MGYLKILEKFEELFGFSVLLVLFVFVFLEIFRQNNIAEVKITLLVGGSRFFSVSRKYPKMNKIYDNIV